MNKIMNLPACTYKSQNFAQSQRNFAPSHNVETMTFRNSAMAIAKMAKWPFFAIMATLSIMATIVIANVNISMNIRSGVSRA